MSVPEPRAERRRPLHAQPGSRAGGGSPAAPEEVLWGSPAASAAPSAALVCGDGRPKLLEGKGLFSEILEAGADNATGNIGFDIIGVGDVLCRRCLCLFPWHACRQPSEKAGPHEACKDTTSTCKQLVGKYSPGLGLVVPGFIKCQDFCLGDFLFNQVSLIEEAV